MHVGDAMVVRVLDVRDVPNGVAGVWANLMDEAVRISGIGASTALVPGGTACLVPIFAYERKTVSDFVSSVIPGRGAPGSVPTTQRWLDQKARLSAFCNASGCLPAMIIEGYMKHAMTGQPLGIMQERHAHAVLHSANRRDGLPFWNSANIHDSARLLVRDAKMVQEDRLLPSGWMRLGTIAGLVQRAADGASSLVIRKSDQATPESWWRAALCLIPGMSANMANAIAADWPSLHHLQRAWAACVSTRQRVAVVADIRYTADKGKGRRIGPVVSERMIERMFKDDADDEPAEDQDEEGKGKAAKETQK